MKTTAQLLQALIDKGERQENIAASLNVSQSRISRIVNGVTTRVDVDLHMAVQALHDKKMRRKKGKK